METLDVRISLDMEPDTEKDDEIFFYYDSLDGLQSQDNKGGEDLVLDGCYGLNMKNYYNNLKITGYDNQMQRTLRQGGGIRNSQPYL